MLEIGQLALKEVWQIREEILVVDTEHEEGSKGE